MRPWVLGAALLLSTTVLMACSLQTGALVRANSDGGMGDAGGDGTFPDVSGPDTGAPVDTGTPPTDSGTPPTDTSTPPTDTSVPPMDTSVPPMDTGPTGPPAGTDLWSRRPPYSASDFEQSMNMHFEGTEIHVPGMCRAREMVTIADPASMSWRDYEVSVTRLRFDDHGCGSDSTFTLVARTQSRTADCASQAGYGCALDIDRDRIYAGRRDDRCGWVGGERETMDTGSVNTGEQYTLKIQVRGSTVTCIFDDGSDEYRVSYTDAAATYSTGGVAFIFQEVDARFGDPSVTAL